MPHYPKKPFADIIEARLQTQDREILAKCAQVYEIRDKELVVSVVAIGKRERNEVFNTAIKRIQLEQIVDLKEGVLDKLSWLQ